MVRIQVLTALGVGQEQHFVFRLRVKKLYDGKFMVTVSSMNLAISFLSSEFLYFDHDNHRMLGYSMDQLMLCKFYSLYRENFLQMRRMLNLRLTEQVQKDLFAGWAPM